MNLLILGANGFIGSNLITRILATTDWHVHAMDLQASKLEPHLAHARLHFHQGDIREQLGWIEEKIAGCDVVLPLVAIASPAAYVQNPLAVFELDFESNLTIVRLCAKHKTRLIFPSSSEVYGMQAGEPCVEDSSNCITGPIHKERWIYSSSKQLLDRVIYAYGTHHALPYTIFRPFNWYGPGLDNVWENIPSNRVIASFLNSMLHRRSITLINGGAQKRCFCYIDDAIDALLRIIENANAAADQQIFNIGHPGAETSIKNLAALMLAELGTHADYQNIANDISLTTATGNVYYGTGYQDMNTRIPDISKAEHKLGWKPTTGLEEGLRKTIAYYIENGRKPA